MEKLPTNKNYIKYKTDHFASRQFLSLRSNTFSRSFRKMQNKMVERKKIFENRISHPINWGEGTEWPDWFF